MSPLEFFEEPEKEVRLLQLGMSDTRYLTYWLFSGCLVNVLEASDRGSAPEYPEISVPAEGYHPPSLGPIVTYFPVHP